MWESLIINFYKAIGLQNFSVTTIALFITIGVFFALVGFFLSIYKFKYIRREFGAKSEMKAKRSLRKTFLLFFSLLLILQIFIHYYFKYKHPLDIQLTLALIINAIAIPGIFAHAAAWLPYKIGYNGD